MTVQTDFSARLGYLKRNHAVCDIRTMGGTNSVVACQPRARATVTGFATDSIRLLKLRSSLDSGLNVTARAQGSGLRRAKSEPGRNPLGARFAQHLPCAAVCPRLRTVILPDDNLVQANAMLSRIIAAVAG